MFGNNHRLPRDVPEAVRERETFKYDSFLIRNTIHSGADSFLSSGQRTSCSDASLIVYAQLAAIRLNAKRALISLFDRKFQYIVAEATPDLPLTPSQVSGSLTQPQLWLSGTALPRPAGVCSRVLVDPHVGAQVHSQDAAHPAGLPVTIIPDITANPATQDSPYCKDWPNNRFYAGVPIRTRRGIDIGMLCILDDNPRESLSEIDARLLQDLSDTVMLRFEAVRSMAGYRRADRMVRGLGSFVEGKSTVSGWQQEVNVESYDPSPSAEGNLNQFQQQRNAEHGTEAARARQDDDSATLQSNETPDLPEALQSPMDVGDDPVPPIAEVPTTLPSHLGDVDHVFSKVSNIIRESIEVEGVLFLDASIASFGGLASAKATAHQHTSSSSSSSSSDEDKGSSSPKSDGPDEAMCRVLGFSTSTSSSVDGHHHRRSHSKVPEKLLAKLLRRYPAGKIFNFDESGAVHSSDFSGDELASPAAEMILGYIPDASRLPPSSPNRNLKQSSKRRFSRQNEGRLIAAMFPGARSVVLVPIWDGQRERWYAGGFAYTKTPTRVFTIEGELSYLRAFGSVIMGEVARVKAISVDRAKTDLLSSLSHELRSPLHGVVLGVELLQDTALDAFQGDVLHSVETCGRTLLDTMDHLLDWSKINNFMPSRRGSSVKPQGTAPRLIRRNSIEAGMMSLTSDVDIAILTEEVVESICAGFNFQRLSIAQLGGAKGSRPGDASTDAVRRLDTMQAVENIITGKTKSGSISIMLGDVAISLDMDVEQSWVYRTQPGAVRRIIMNILGNSLKYTSSGFIKVCLSRHTSSRQSNTHHVQLTIVDSGQGISQDYIQHRMFSPFSQEDSLAAGAGLGLSLVKKIVTSLGGSVHIQSEINKGTVVTVRLPLPPAPQAPVASALSEGDDIDEFEAQVSELQGLRVRIVGFETTFGDAGGKCSRETHFSQGGLVVKLCRDWLRLHVIEAGQEKEFLPDFVLCNEPNINRAFKMRGGNSSVPVVVICSDPLVARRLSTSPAFSGRAGVVEFISQPVGPRKLAKILLLSFRRWTSSRSGRANSSTLSGGSSEQLMLGTPDVPTPDVPTPSLAPSTESLAEPPTPEDDGLPLASGPGADNVTVDAEGTVEELNLPMRPGQDLPPMSPQISQGPTEGSSAATPRPAEFLLVDDNPVNLKMISHHMKKLGHTFDTATDGKQAFEAVRSSGGQYRCIFMDVQMPVMDGMESSRQVRALERERHLPRCQIFALTGLASEAAQQEAFASGIDLFLTKPVKLKELNRILDERKLA